MAEQSFTATLLKQGGPALPDMPPTEEEDAEDVGLDDLELTLAPSNAIYFLLDDVAIRAVSRSGQVTAVQVDKLRYRPGATLKGKATVVDASGTGGTGTLNIYLEHNVQHRVKVQSLPVQLGSRPQNVAFELALPRKEFGYALIAEFVSADGRDRHEAADYFNIAENFYRVALFNVNAGGDDIQGMDDASIQRWLKSIRHSYANVVEWFSWAEEDMVEMSPDTGHWFSGQTCYAKSRDALQRRIRFLHKHGPSAKERLHVPYGNLP
ncbi:MAG: hypothetical protein ACYTGH_14335 [Planctomycetota bacterium]